jgi:CubicO group peptidase (beta-lactamase class C family)
MPGRLTLHFSRFKKLPALTLCLLLLPRPAVFGQTTAPPEPLKALDAYVEKGLSDWRIPGLAIAVVKDDRVIFARGYGVREVGKAERVDEKTLFGVGSVTKSFTAAGVGLLVDEKKMAWDDAAVKHLPGLQLYDASLTSQVTLRDLLSHRTGLPRANGSLLIGYDRAETARRMRYLKPAAGLRSQFTYNNHMYLFAGLALEAVSKTSWEEFVRKRLFAPLNMTASNTSVSAFTQGSNVAQPHASIQSKVQRLPLRGIESHAPAGAVNSNALDMSNWVRMFLNKGSFEGRQILSPQVVRILQSQQTVIPVGPLSEKLFPSTHFQGYGMGWFVRDYRGRKVVEHGGNVDGMTAQVGMLPEENLGVVIMSNMNATPFPLALMYRVFDAFLGDAEKQADLSAEYLKLSKEGEAQARAMEKEAGEKRAAETKPTLPPEGYAGTYANDLYGGASVTVKGGRLYLKFNDAAQGELEHWEKDTFRIAWTNPLYVEAVGKTLLTFQLDGGKVSEFKAQNLADYKRVSAGGGD